MSSPENPQFNPQPLGSEPPLPLAADSFSPPELLPAPVSPRDPAWSGWDVLQIALLTIGTLVFLQLIAILGAWKVIYPRSSFAEVARNPTLALISEFVAYIVVAVYMVMLVEGKYHVGFWRAIHWSWPGRAGVKLFGLGVLMVSLDALGRYLPMPKSVPFDQFFARPLDAYLTAGFAITFGPLMEELFFRGFLYPVLQRRLGTWLAVFFTALPFGLVHLFQYGYAWGAVLVIFLVGVVLTVVRVVTGSVACSFLAHVGYNTTLMVLAAVATDGFRHMEKASCLLF